MTEHTVAQSLYSQIDVTDYGDKIEYSAEGATLEMWIASWNQKGENFRTDKYIKLYTKCDSKGYYIGNGEKSTTFLYNVGQGTDGYKDTLYFPYAKETKVGETNGYRLASSSVYETTREMNIYGDGLVSRIQYNYKNFAFRPIVCLPETVLGVESADGLNWSIQY